MDVWNWVQQHWQGIAGLPVLAAVGGAVLSGLFVYFKLMFWGSRRSSKNWAQTMELSGDTSLLKLGLKRVNPDTAYNEGDAASVYYQSYTSFVYEIVDGVRYCFSRSFVVEVYAFYQWETERRLGENLMTQFASDPIPCMGLEETKDTKGVSYWVKVPKADTFVEKTPLAKLEAPKPPTA